MSNNPPLPPPNMDDFEATMIRAQNPPPAQFNQPQCTCTGDSPMHDDDCPLRQSWRYAPAGNAELAPPIKNRARPRRADREKLLDRDSWKVLAIIMFMAFAAGMLGGAVFLLMINHI